MMKKHLILLLVLICAIVEVQAQHIDYVTTFKVMKDYMIASSEMIKNHPDGIVAKNVKVYYGQNASEIEYYSFVYNSSAKVPYYCVLDTALMDYCKIDKRNFYRVNSGTRELTHIKKSALFKYKSLKSTTEGQHKSIDYYISMGDIKPEIIYALYKKTDTIVRTKPCLVFYASNFHQEYRRDAVYYINKTNYELDSVICISTGTNGNRYITRKEILFDAEDINIKEIDNLFSFDNPEYSEYTKHDGKNDPLSFAHSDNEDFSVPQVANFELHDLNNKTTTIQDEKGWVLLDIWMFGCTGCYAGFKQMGQQIDSIGQTNLEKNGVKVICVNPMSDNMELIAKVAEKYNVNNLLYAGKGLTALIKIPSYPTYYLISPKKELVKKGTFFDDEDILSTIEQYNQ